MPAHDPWPARRGAERVGGKGVAVAMVRPQRSEARSRAAALAGAGEAASFPPLE